MGYMTVVSILNDAWDTIKENPEQFIKNIEDGMENYNGKTVNMYSVGNYANPMEVHTSFHSNHNNVLVVGGNHMENVAKIQSARANDEFYLTYKIKIALEAKRAADEALTEAQDAFVKLVIHDMKRAGKTVDEISPFIYNYQAFQHMDPDTQQLTILKVGVRFDKQN